MQSTFLQYELTKKYDEIKGLNGTRIDIRDGLIKLWVSYENISSTEITTIAYSSFSMAVKTYGSISMIGFNFNSCVLIAPYNQFEIPHGFLEAAELPENHGIPLLILVGESRTGELKKMRACALPHDFSVQLVEILKKQHDSNIDTYTLAAFNDSVDQFFNNHTLMEAFYKPGELEVNCIVNSNKK